MIRLILAALSAVLIPFAGVILLSGALFFISKPKTRASIVACLLVPPVTLALGLLWWGRSTGFLSYLAAHPGGWTILGPALACTVIGLVTATFTVVAFRRRVTETRPGGITKTLVAVLLVILLGAIAIVLGDLAYLERYTWESSYYLSNALRNARSVTFVEFSGLSILGRKVATPEDRVRFQNAISPWFLPFGPRGALCFDPHHRVEIVGATGTQVTFEVCFLCGNFYVDPVADADIRWGNDLPPSWDKNLRLFFASMGMSPKTQEEYTSLDRADANDQGAKAQR